MLAQGSGGTRNVGGNTHYRVDLEAELADLPAAKDGALLFTSGYVSNDATLSTLAAIPARLRYLLGRTATTPAMIAGIRTFSAEKKVFRAQRRGAIWKQLLRRPIRRCPS